MGSFLLCGSTGRGLGGGGGEGERGVGRRAREADGIVQVRNTLQPSFDVDIAAILQQHLTLLCYLMSHTPMVGTC